MCMLSRRLQILLDEERYQRLSSEATRSGLSVGALVRKAIDRAFPAGSDRRARAARAILSADPMEVPEPAELRRELEDARGRER